MKRYFLQHIKDWRVFNVANASNIVLNYGCLFSSMNKRVWQLSKFVEKFSTSGRQKPAYGGRSCCFKCLHVTFVGDIVVRIACLTQTLTDHVLPSSTVFVEAAVAWFAANTGWELIKSESLKWITCKVCCLCGSSVLHGKLRSSQESLPNLLVSNA